MTKKTKIIIAVVVLTVIAGICAYKFWWQPKAEKEAADKAAAEKAAATNNTGKPVTKPTATKPGVAETKTALS